MSKTITFTYINHAGKRAERTVDVETLEFIKDPGFGYQGGWFISGRCHDKNARRSFSLSRIVLPDSETLKIFTLMRF